MKKQIYIAMKWGYVIDSVWDSLDKAKARRDELTVYSWKISVHPAILNKVLA